MHVHNSVIKHYIAYLKYRQMIPIPLLQCDILINYIYIYIHIYMLGIVMYYVIIPTYHFCSIRKALVCCDALLVF